ncbi:MAG TPA: O-antigen ligase family protein [Vicinamibacterales bacterium]
MALAWGALVAVVAPETGIPASLAAIAVFATTLWRPAIGVTAAVALAPAGALFAPYPSRTAELFAWAFLSAWLLRVWRPLAPAGWPRAIVVPALLYGACAATSWLALTIASGTGVPVTSLPAFLLNAIPRHYLVFSPPETETWTLLQLITGVGVFLAASACVRAERMAASRIAWAFVLSLTLLAAATIADVVRQWAGTGYGGWFLARYPAGARFSLHLADVNAAASLYVLAGGIAVARALFDRRTRWLSLGALAVMAPALWLTGSRSAALGAGGAAAAIVLAANASRLTLTRRQGVAAAACVVALVAAAGALVLAGGGNERGSAGRALRLRWQFSETSARMFASAPVLGVGVGRYFERSPEFMPDEVRALYGAENAHNYFAQAFAEVGTVGGAMFLWLIGAALVAGWRQAGGPERGGLPRAESRSPAVALFAGSTGYLLTCLTGHPFLVPEAALPFWIAFGALAGGGAAATSASTPPRHRRVAALVVVCLAVGVARAFLVYAAGSTTTAERGFDREETAPDGRRFRWMGPHVVTYVSPAPGFFRMTLRAPDRPLRRPMVVETVIAGRVVDRRAIAPDHWQTVEIPVRERLSSPVRRIDVRATPSWMEQRRLAQRESHINVELTAMVSELRWVGPGGR